MKKLIIVTLIALAISARAQIRIPLAVPVASPDMASIIELRGLSVSPVEELDGTYSWKLSSKPDLVATGEVWFCSGIFDRQLESLKVTRADLDTVAVAHGIANGWPDVTTSQMAPFVMEAMVKKLAVLLGQPDAWIQAVLQILDAK